MHVIPAPPPEEPQVLDKPPTTSSIEKDAEAGYMTDDENVDRAVAESLKAAEAIKAEEDKKGMSLFMSIFIRF